ncbi:hypothetical protein V1478_017966 [Vespula squamosa]|uniref:Uncharacterized protein n=1 Tax=Vespula squamosa TaxID=30214 RepID=A0ABD1ZVQ3_VESSQ
MTSLCHGRQNPEIPLANTSNTNQPPAGYAALHPLPLLLLLSRVGAAMLDNPTWPPPMSIPSVQDALVRPGLGRLPPTIAYVLYAIVFQETCTRHTSENSALRYAFSPKKRPIDFDSDASIGSNEKLKGMGQEGKDL